MPSSHAHKAGQLLQSMPSPSLCTCEHDSCWARFALLSHRGRSSVTLHPKLFPTGPGMHRADSSKEVRIKSLASKTVLWQRVLAFCSRRILLLLEQLQADHKVSCIPWEPRQENLETDATFLPETSAVAPQPQHNWGSENNYVSRTGTTHRGLHRPLQGKSLCSTLPAGLSTQTRTARQMFR